MARSGASGAADTKPEAGQVGGDEPLPAWEQELLSGAAAAAEPAPTSPGATAGAADTAGTAPREVTQAPAVDVTVDTPGGGTGAAPAAPQQ